MRVMHDSRGRPLISMLHEPHLPALQFHRIARSLASRAWIRWSTSRTTMPSSTSASNVLKSPPVASPRHTRKVRLAIVVTPSIDVSPDLARLQILDLRVRDRDEVGRPLGLGSLLDHHPVRALLHDHVVLDPVRALARV